MKQETRAMLAAPGAAMLAAPLAAVTLRNAGAAPAARADNDGAAYVALLELRRLAQ